MENRCYRGIATWERLTYHKQYTMVFYCYSFLFISREPPYKEIWPLSTFRDACVLNISVTEAYNLKHDILVIALFAMFASNSKLTANSIIIILFIFNHFQVYLAASHTCKWNIYDFSIPFKNTYGCIGIFGSHTLLIIITNVNLIIKLFLEYFERNKEDFWGKWDAL